MLTVDPKEELMQSKETNSESKKRKYSDISEEKLDVLENRFRLQPFLTTLHRSSLAAELNLPDDMVDEWYEERKDQYKRSKKSQLF